MENVNQTNESINPVVETVETVSTTTSAIGRAGRWVKNTVYGFAGLVLLALGITVVSPETAVGLTQYLPKQYQETIFASAASGETCSAGMPVGGYVAGCCSSMPTAASSSTGASCCAAEPPQDMAADIPALSLENMLAGLNDL